jgi:iron complex transport system ATP-binding protein
MVRLKPILSLRHLTLEREAKTILAGIDWTVQRGEHWVILGPNGSGKTSLLSALTGYLPPSDGDVTVLGETFGESDWRELRKHVGLVSSSIRQRMADDETALVSVVSGKYAMIDYWGRITAGDRQAARKILRQVEAESIADRPWLYLSQGERQRVLIGRALMAKPQLLILDEPCAGLDPVARDQFLHFVQRLGSQKNAPTLILVTHHVEEITPCFTHVLLLAEGRITKQGLLRATLTSSNLSQTFRHPVIVRRSQGRYGLRLSPKSR